MAISLLKKSILNREEIKSLSLLCIFSFLLFFSSSIYAVQNSNMQSLDAQSLNIPNLNTQDLNTENSEIKQKNLLQDTMLQEAGTQDAQAPTQNVAQEKQVADNLSDEKKNYSFLSSQTFSNVTNNTKKKEPSTNTDALSVSLGLIFILILIFSLAWFIKKMGYSNLTGQGQLKIIATLNLGQKEKIALIQVGKQQLVVGITPTQINTLHVLDELLIETAVDEMDVQAKDKRGIIKETPFANKLSEFLSNKK